MKHARHPRINYWFWTEKTFQNKGYLATLERVAKNGRFDMLTITDRGCDFWDPTHKEDFRLLVRRAHELGLKIVMQLWPKGFLDSTAFFSYEEAGAVVVDVETEIVNGHAVLRSKDKWTRCSISAPAIKSEFLYVVAFKKTAEGYYDPDSLLDVSDRIKIEYESPDRVSASLSLPECEGYTVFGIAAHYHRIADVFSDRMLKDYSDIMYYYADVPFDGFTLDEFKGIPSEASWTLTEPYRGRLYGVSLDRIFKEKTGKDLKRVLFDMRYCPDGCDFVRASAINDYFDVYRRGVVRTENLVAELSKKLFGKNAFLGFHNTYHNALTNDEIWNTGCAWWEVKRDYAQTDENMIMPVRLALACQAKESIHYDMFYTPEKEKFFEKCLRDAAYGGRTHYHAIDDGSKWGLDTGSDAFLSEVALYEDAVELLNRFEPVMPEIPLLIVFGFPALCNWYPDESARGKFDVNDSLSIMETAQALWQKGYLNVLAPDDALIDGRITLDEDCRFDYCGHKFKAMLFMHPEYAKPQTIAFLKAAIEKGADMRVIGNLTHGFDGNEIDGSFLAPVTVQKDFDPGLVYCILPNDIESGCRLADGSVVLSHYESMRDGTPYHTCFSFGADTYEVSFIGTFAIKINENGTVEKLVSAELCDLKKNGKPFLPEVRGASVCYGIE